MLHEIRVPYSLLVLQVDWISLCFSVYAPLPPLGRGGSQLLMKVMIHPVWSWHLGLCFRGFFFTFPLHQHLFFRSKRFLGKKLPHTRSFRKNLIIVWKASYLPVLFNILSFSFYCTSVFTEIWQLNTLLKTIIVNFVKNNISFWAYLINMLPTQLCNNAQLIMLSCLLIDKSILKQAALSPLLNSQIPVKEFSNKAFMNCSTSG